MKKTDDIKDLLSALSKAQLKFRPVAFDKVNPHFKSKFASLSAIEEMIKVPMAENGLCVSHFVGTNDKGELFLETLLGHVSGQWMASEFRLLLSKQDMQGLGSAVTYAKRYALSALLNVSSDEDDDGNAAVQKPSSKTSTPPSPFPDEWDQRAQPKPQSASAKKSEKAAVPGSQGLQTAKSQPSPSSPDAADPIKLSQADQIKLIRLEDQLKGWKFPTGANLGKTLLDIGFQNAKRYHDWVTKEVIEKHGREPEHYQLKALELFKVYQEYEALRIQSVGEVFDPNEKFPV